MHVSHKAVAKKPMLFKGFSSMGREQVSYQHPAGSGRQHAAKQTVQRKEPISFRGFRTSSKAQYGCTQHTYINIYINIYD